MSPYLSCFSFESSIRSNVTASPLESKTSARYSSAKYPYGDCPCTLVHSLCWLNRFSRHLSESSIRSRAECKPLPLGNGIKLTLRSLVRTRVDRQFSSINERLQGDIPWKYRGHRESLQSLQPWSLESFG